MVRQVIQTPGNTVIATCRTPANATALQSLADGASGKLHVIKMDTSDENSIEEAVTSVKEIVGDSGIDYLINNAALVSRRLLTFYRI